VAGCQKKRSWLAVEIRRWLVVIKRKWLGLKFVAGWLEKEVAGC